MKRLFLFLFLTIALTLNAELYQVNKFPIKSTTEISITVLTKAEVVRVVDGDTIRVSIKDEPGLSPNESIRLIGVDTPETVHPSKPVQFYGREASDFTKKMLDKQTIYLAFDRSVKDRYNRVLAYVYLEDGRCFNSLLIQEGYARAYLSFPFKFREEFKILESTAKEQKKGLWNVNSSGYENKVEKSVKTLE